MRLRLTPAQKSALECAGLDIDPEGDDAELARAWNGDYLDVLNHNQHIIASALCERSNSEDAGEDTYSRRAARSLGALYLRVLKLEL